MDFSRWSIELIENRMEKLTEEKLLKRKHSGNHNQFYSFSNKEMNLLDAGCICKLFWYVMQKSCFDDKKEKIMKQQQHTSRLYTYCIDCIIVCSFKYVFVWLIHKWDASHSWEKLFPKTKPRKIWGKNMYIKGTNKEFSIFDRKIHCNVIRNAYLVFYSFQTK